MRWWRFTTAKLTQSSFLNRGLFGLSPFDLTARCQTLVSQNAQSLDFWPLAAAFAVFQDFDIARTGHAVLIGRIGFLSHGSPKHKKLAYVLNGRRVELIGQGGEHFFAFEAIVPQDTNFDQAMGIERHIGFFENGGRESVVADHDHRV